MQFGIRLHDAVQAPIEERLRIVKEQGFTCAHVALSKVISENSVAPSALTPGYAMYLKRLFDKNELDCAVLGCYLNLANPDAAQLRQIQDKYMANIRFSAHLGAGVVGTETGAPNTAYKFEEACWNEESLADVYQKFASCRRVCRTDGRTYGDRACGAAYCVQSCPRKACS